MTGSSLAAALEREHHDIDRGVELFSSHPTGSEAVQALAEAIAALRRHIYLEEEFLFPALSNAGGNSAGGLVAPIFVMLREHAQMWEVLDLLDGELGLLADAGADVGRTDTAWSLCHRLQVQLQHHNLKEERIIYPAADRVLPTSTAQRLGEFVNSSRLPVGWVCARARV